MFDHALVRILIPAGLTIALALGGAGWRQSIINEHRVTATEAAEQYQAKALDSTTAKLILMEAKYDSILLSLGRIEGQLSTQALQARVLPSAGKK